jgi:hypothetical protein
MPDKFSLKVPFEPDAYLFVLAASDSDPVLKCKHSCGM